MKTNFRKAIYTLLLASTVSSFAYASSDKPSEPEKKTVKISGTIIDQNTGEALVGVKVYFLNSDKFVYTDFDGKFIIESRVADDAKLSASLISYEEKSIAIDNSKTFTLKLKRQK